jgi:DNA replication and repair protein RecF
LRIQRLATTHFRNLVHEPISFSPGVNLFVGNNGEGKTNILEALSLFKIGRSYRTSRDTDLVSFSQPFSRVEVSVEKKDAGTDVFSASIERDGTKRIKVNSKEVAKLSELVGLYPCVLFGPQDLEVVSGGPGERRGFLDVTGSMTDRAYLDELRGYRRVLGQRNSLLKKAGSRGSRDVWDEELVRRGCAVIEKRMGLVDALFSHLEKHVEALGAPYRVEFVYESDVLENLPEGVTPEEQFTANLVDVEEEEFRRKTTLIGPHRDDLRILLDGRGIRRFGSQGQRRLLAVLLRLTELSYIEERLGEPCVLLLDDLFSELDHDASTKLRALLENDHQIFVTSPIVLEWGDGRSVRTFRVENGRVSV